MASVSAQSEAGAPGVPFDDDSREQEAYVAGHMGAECDGCGREHALNILWSRRARHVVCDECYEDACEAELEEEPAEPEDDEEEEPFPAADEYDYNMMADASDW